MFATTKAILLDSLPRVKGTYAREETVIRFRTATGTIVSARAMPSPSSPANKDDDEDDDGEFYALGPQQGKTKTALGLKFVDRGAGDLEIGPFGVIILTHLTPDRDYIFVSRVFVSNDGFIEDHVYGSAHTFIVSYYASFPQSRVKAGQEVYARQVSPRGGDLWVILDEEKGVADVRTMVPPRGRSVLGVDSSW
ncbi:hypothetical protein PAXRUDRAFT_16677 [Paxillus rubicundulus Ve08.2h10]|uniref:Uncharacterized protein n=1 Tax=Paxillus rubicundulus Ve08.2h10 TaxID=930991 RepID=A0A0D0C6V3_9AGAM|nr:hypothetical protein PAXRUDRAFT_16677 [Paxillus rubicundulus Ve08.2h10]